MRPEQNNFIRLLAPFDFGDDILAGHRSEIARSQDKFDAHRRAFGNETVQLLRVRH